MKLRQLFFIFLLIEIALFIIVGKLIGVLPTLLLIVLTTILGIILLRKQNLTIMRQMHTTMRTGKAFHLNFAANSFVTLAGILLIIPGFLTDALGILLLIPALRSSIAKLFIATPTTKKADKDIIEGEFWEEDNKKDQLPPRK